MDPKADSKRILDGFKKDQKQIQKEFVSLNSGSVAKKKFVYLKSGSENAHDYV